MTEKKNKQKDGKLLFFLLAVFLILAGLVLGVGKYLQKRYAEKNKV